MTLDETIKRTEELVELNEDQARVYKEQGDTMGYWSYEECAKEHRQLAEWLKELKQLREQTKWIPCTERLPEPNRLVLCYVTTGASETYFLAFWNDNLNAWEEGIGGIRLLENDLGYEVKAWMPSLPQPYKAESEG